MIHLRDLPFTDRAREEIAALARPRVLTLGVFDGLHLAHRRLVDRVVETARLHGGSALVLTFSNHPLSILAPPYAPKQLLGIEAKAALLSAMGIDALIVPRFTADLARIDPERFISEILADAIGADRLIVGFDFRFGKEGAGKPALLQSHASEKGFEVEVLPAIHHDGREVSSTLVRELIDTGRVRLAAEFLGRPFELSGPVVHGHGRGRTLGYPTANLKFDPAFAIPPRGVYVVRVVVGERVCGGIMNLGASPTFAGTEFRPEVFLLDFGPEDLYGRTLTVRFIDRLREERAFESAHALRQRLRVDEAMARAVLEATPAAQDAPRSFS